MKLKSTATGRLRTKLQVLLVLAVALMVAAGLLVTSCGGGAPSGNTTTTAPGGGSSSTAGVTTTAGATTTTAGPTTTTAGATTTTGATTGAQVSLKNFKIDPAAVTIKAGDSVTWTNNDGFAHNVVGDKGEFDSGNMAAGATFTFKFTTPGTVAYHCSIHPFMTGTITVQ